MSEKKLEDKDIEAWWEKEGKTLLIEAEKFIKFMDDTLESNKPLNELLDNSENQIFIDFMLKQLKNFPHPKIESVKELLSTFKTRIKILEFRIHHLGLLLELCEKAKSK